MGGQQKDFISDIVFFQHQDGMRLKVRRHFLQCMEFFSALLDWMFFFFNTALSAAPLHCVGGCWDSTQD
jgi:hypothetical protein